MSQDAIDQELSAPVSAERRRQDSKWGEQNHENFTLHHARHFPDADIARERCEMAFADGKGSWSHVLMEEVAEAIDEAKAGDLDALTTELVQVEAVARAWREAIERQDVEPEMPCCDYRDHGGRACACPEHPRSILHPWGATNGAGLP